MATLNLSQDGPAINRSYQSIVDIPLPSGGAAATSPTYGQWAVYSVSAPLTNAFQGDSGKESVLRVQTTGEGELVDLIEEFSDGRIQFAFVKVKDPNSGLGKSVLIAWCGEGVPERTKGYFGSHLTAATKLLRGYHVQITARSDQDVTPEGIIRKVADASGSKYGGDTAPTPSSGGPLPLVASKPVFTPTQSGGGASARGFNPLSSRTRTSAPQDTNVDEDGWGADAPPVTRSQLEKVGTAYKPTKVNMAELTSRKQEPSRFESPTVSVPRNGTTSPPSDVIRGGYQPIGKVDIAAIRRQAQVKDDDRPSTVKGAYEPVGKVDIAAINARAQPPSDLSSSSAAAVSSTQTGGSSTDDGPKSLADRSAAFMSSERITSMPKPQVSNRFGSSTSSFTGTKAPLPGGMGFVSKTIPASAPIGMASKNFADQGGKTPAQIWSEKKAQQGGNSGAGSAPRSTSTATTPITSQTSGGGWDAGYSGKKWAAVSTSKTGQSATSGSGITASGDGAEEEQSEPASNVSAIRDRFKNAAPMGRGAPGGFDEAEEEQQAPPPPMASRPNVSGIRGGVPMPGFAHSTPAQEEYPVKEASRMPTPPAQPPRSPTPPTPSGSPIRIAMPVGRGRAEPMDAPETFDGPPLPTASMARNIPDQVEDEPEIQKDDPARGASQAVAASSFGAAAMQPLSASSGAGRTAIAQFDYEMAEENELELKEGERVSNIEMIDEDWWKGENERGEMGFFPSNYVELVEGGTAAEEEAEEEEEEEAPPAMAARPTPAVTLAKASGPTATAQFDYEATEDNELSFPDGATITALEFPDEDWWSGEYNGQKGLFPANYVVLDE